MKILANIERRNAEKMVIKINILLAEYEIFYHNFKKINKKNKTTEFFDLNKKIEAIYNNLFVKIDEIAERILTVECAPLESYNNYLMTMRCNKKKLEIVKPMPLNLF